MKISQNDAAAAIQARAKVNQTQDNEAAKPKKETTINPQSSLNRMTKWFSLIGIQAEYSQAKPLSTNEKVARKNTLLAQRKYHNLENILGKAVDFCLDEEVSEELDADWFFSFINMAEQVYSPAMQELWGKIFAVESARPGSFSLKTLSLLQQLTHKDAQTFRHAVNLASKRKGESVPKLLLGYYQQPSLWSLFQAKHTQQLNLAEFGLGYPDILSLMDLGLIHQSEIESGELSVDKQYAWRCAGQSIEICPKRSATTLKYYKFTTTGAELCQLVGRTKQVHYLNKLIEILDPAFDIS